MTEASSILMDELAEALPIETAPKDGTKLLLWMAGTLTGDGWIVGCWVVHDPFESDEGEWCGHVPSLGLASLREYRVTHWSPLPKRPDALARYDASKVSK